MAQTFFFYDLETSGLNAREDRIMQFAGIRTDSDFNQIGEPYNLLVALNDDTLPSPGALMVTGITPQQTITDGYTEAQFAQLFINEICTPDTILLGYNNVRFDDEFMRALLWRNFYDPYEWSYKDGRSRWDMLDVVRLTRALRSEGIEWPTVDGVAVNKLELLSQANGLLHEKAHDALSDVEALIAVTKLIATKQPQLFQYLLKLRHKKEVQQLVDIARPKPFVYASGRYAAEYNKTTVAYPLAEADFGNVFVYDLRHNPAEWVKKTEAELQAILQTPWEQRDESYQALPVKKLQYNRTPAVAPLGVLEQQDGWQKIGLDLPTIEAHKAVLAAHPEFANTVAKVLLQKPDYAPLPDAEAKLYDGFVSDRDKLRAEAVRNATEKELATHQPKFDDARLVELFPRYKARNFPQQLTDDERANYEAYRTARLQRQLPGFMKDLSVQAAKPELTNHQQYVLQELQLWLESIMPAAE
ncbi:MAG: exodeoxyribonuclease I [Candidatus Saccharibacteria bacterium]|nr:exodeoxyribonuclease I [Candidatus Saccharibacteria bacterium]